VTAFFDNIYYYYHKQKTQTMSITDLVAAACSQLVRPISDYLETIFDNEVLEDSIVFTRYEARQDGFTPGQRVFSSRGSSPTVRTCLMNGVYKAPAGIAIVDLLETISDNFPPRIPLFNGRLLTGPQILTVSYGVGLATFLHVEVTYNMDYGFDMISTMYHKFNYDFDTQLVDIAIGMYGNDDEGKCYHETGLEQENWVLVGRNGNR
jgi:hypothetical protein